MTSHPRKMILALLVNGVGQHQAGWRVVDSRAEDAYSLSLYAEAARMAEAAKMHMVFLADSADHDQATLGTRPKRFLEALSVAASLVPLTQNIGLTATFSTTFTEPYNVARQMCSLDHLSRGRAGWNMVTSYGGAEHYGAGPMMTHEQRHRRAAEYAQVIRMLFDSWDADALVVDRASGIYADPDKVRCERFDGEVFQVSGPLNMPRLLQGRPVIAQAGQSAAGKDLSAQHADMVYAQGTSLEESQAHYADLKARMARFGRDPNSLKVLPGCVPVIGETEAEARSMQDQLNDLLDMLAARHELQKRLPGVPLDDYDLDEVLPAGAFPPVDTVQTMQTRYEIYRHWAVDKRYTIRDIIGRMTTGGGHWSPCGSAERIAAEMQERFTRNGCDGFNLSSTFQLGGSERITRLLVPAPQAAGHYRTQYEGATLRENMGLPEPPAHASARRA